MSTKVTNMRDWMLYLENDKIKAFDITGNENTSELKELCEANDIPVIGYVAFEKEIDALMYGDMLVQ